MTREQEAAVIRRVLDGDGNAFEALVAAYEKNVYNLALRMTGNAQDAEDMARIAAMDDGGFFDTDNTDWNK